MTLAQFSQYVTWLLYMAVFVATVARAVRRPVRANIDIALLFSMPALTIGISIVAALGLFTPGAISNAITTSLLLIMGYLLLRMVDDFAQVARWGVRTSEVSLALLVVGTFAFSPPRPGWLIFLQLAYLLIMLVYTTIAFVQASRRTSGVTMRRMTAVAAGSFFLWSLFVIAGIALVIPGVSAYTTPLVSLVSFASGVSYFLGFATPNVLRRAWQEPELRAFLGRAASLPRLPSTQAIISELEKGAAHSLGATDAKICMWDEPSETLRYFAGGEEKEIDPKLSVIGRSFLTQKAIFTDNLQRDAPAYAEVIRAYGAVAQLAAPITAGQKKLGVLAVYSQRAPIFADEDLALVQLLADQAAVILESRALIDEATRVRAREEATRMKDDFLSAAAHDLKTPLTTLVVQSELLERKAQRNPSAPADIASLRKMTKEVHRLKSLVLELLDAARAEQGRLVGERVEIDLAEVARDVCSRHSTGPHRCDVEAEGAVPGVYDPNRMLQLLENLVENAVKYSPGGGEIKVRLWGETDPTSNQTWNHITVTDRGIGIPKEDLPRLFDRFHRGGNVDDKSFAGMGLGLFICRGIVEQHGGRIWVESSTPGRTGSGTETTRMDIEKSGGMINGNGALPGGNGNGSSASAVTTFHVALPAAPAESSDEESGPAAERSAQVGIA